MVMFNLDQLSFEDYAIDKTLAIFKYINNKYKRLNNESNIILTFHAYLFENDKNQEIFDNPSNYLDLICLALNGTIKSYGKYFSFKRVIQKEESVLIKDVFYLIIAHLVSLSYLEIKNLYKSITIIKRNSLYIYHKIKERILDEKFIDYEVTIDEIYLKYIKRHLPELFDIIYSSDRLYKI